MSNGFNPFTEKLKHFAPLSVADEKRLDELVSKTRLYGPGEEILVSENDCALLPVVIEGVVSRARRLGDNRRQINSFLLPGDMCDPHRFTLTRGQHVLNAVGVARVALVPAGMLEKAWFSDTALARALWRSAQMDSAVAREWVVMLGRLDARARTAHLICELQARLELVSLSDSNTFEMPLTERILADVLGLSVVHVNRTMRRLQNDGLLRVRHAVIEIMQATRLREVAGFDPAYLYLSPQDK